jgi:hypothetical protein
VSDGGFRFGQRTFTFGGIRDYSRPMLWTAKVLALIGLVAVAGGSVSAALLKTRVVGQTAPSGHSGVTLGERGREAKIAPERPLVAVPGGTARVIGTPGQSWGDMAATVSWARAHEPYTLLMRVTSRPPQSVTGTWALVCTKDFAAGSRSGRVAARTPFTRLLPLPMKQAMNCSVGASARLNGTGLIEVTLLAQCVRWCGHRRGEDLSLGDGRVALGVTPPYTPRPDNF